MMEFVRLQNADHGSIPDYWNVPLNSYNTELCFVTKDSVVAAPKLLMRTIFPELDSMLCPGCVETHERITVIIKDLESSEIVEAFKSLASGDPDHIVRVLELKTRSGELYDIVLLISEGGMGKTTFMKFIAQVFGMNSSDIEGLSK